MDKQLLFEQTNAAEPSAMKYLGECYSRAANEGKPNVRKRNRAEDRTDDIFSADKERAIDQCQKEIVDRARYVVGPPLAMYAGYVRVGGITLYRYHPVGAPPCRGHPHAVWRSPCVCGAEGGEVWKHLVWGV